MTDALGLSIGMTNLVAAREGREPVIRRSILTLYSDRAPEVGEYTGNGLPLAGFVERVGDPVPLVAADGSQHRGELVLAEALDVMARLAGGGAPIAIAVPAHWGPGTIGALRAALRNKPALIPDGVPPALVPDSLTALAALQAQPGLPADGVVVLCDLGGSGTSVTLADAGAGFTTVGSTVRYPDFSGDQIDQALLNHVLSGVATANETDPGGTAAVGSLTRLRAECRQAKERLSAETATAIPTELPGFHADVRVTRPELDQLVSAPLAGLLDAIEDTLQRNNIALSSVTAVATVGGGAAIPLVTQRLSERLRAPVVTTPQPALVVATGAALVADRVAEAGAPTGMAPEVAAADAPTGMAPTGMAPTGMAPTAAAPAANGGDSAAFGALAWSQDDAPGSEPVPYEGGDYDATAGTAAARPAVEFSHDEEMYDAAPTPLPWYKRPPILFGAAAAAALLAAGGLAVTLTSSEGDSSPVTETSTTYSMGPSPEGPPPEPVTTVTQGPDGIETTTVIAPPPPPPETTTSEPTSESETTTTTTSPTTTTTTTTTQPTTTTTTTRTTTTQPPTTTTQPPTTTNPPTTTAAPPTTTAADSGDGGGA